VLDLLLLGKELFGINFSLGKKAGNGSLGFLKEGLFLLIKTSLPVPKL